MNATDKVYTTTTMDNDIDAVRLASEEFFSDDAVAYRALVVSTLSIVSIGIVLNIILIASMGVPLLLPNHRKDYSTYNLYLVFLCFPDLVVCIYVVYLILTRHDSGFYPLIEEDGTVKWMFENNRFDHDMYALCVPANLYTNAFLIYECYLLLKDSSKIRRHAPPSILRVTKQAMVAYSIGICAFVLEAVFADNLQDGSVAFILYQASSYLLFVAVPLLILTVLWVKIHREGLTKSTMKMFHGRLRLLVNYFVRIVLTYLICTGIGTVSYMIYWTTVQDITRTKVFCYVGFLFFIGVHTMANFVIALTKPDARNYVWNLLVCDYCKSDDGKPDDETASVTEVQQDPFLGSDDRIECHIRRFSQVAEPAQSNRQYSFEARRLDSAGNLIDMGSGAIMNDEHEEDKDSDEKDLEESSGFLMPMEESKKKPSRPSVLSLDPKLQP